jgi:hypothetical protein
MDNWIIGLLICRFARHAICVPQESTKPVIHKSIQRAAVVENIRHPPSKRNDAGVVAAC